MKLAVIFPGIGYNIDKPLLYYSRKIAAKHGYDEICVSYTNLNKDIKGDAKKMEEAYLDGLSQVENQLADVDFTKYEDVLFIGKSIGASVAGGYAKKHGIKPRFILYTPVEATLSIKYDDAVVFSGNSDDWCDSYRLRALCDEQNIDIHIISDANHSLETGIPDTDTQNLVNIMQWTQEYIAKSANPNLRQALNPYMGANEYVPDGEPYVFGDRVYVYGSHDMFDGNIYCMLHYICWSAPVSDLGNWRYEGIIYRKDQDPDNTDSRGMLYAPDVAKGVDGRYYLYYAINAYNHISVAVCDHPAGKYEFYGFVHYADGTRLGDRESDEMQFDPGVLVEDDKVFLFTGFCPVDAMDRHGAMLTVLDKDMVTIVEEPRFVAPSGCHSQGTGFEGHEFFEAPSIRKIGNKYAFIYSSIKFHELCYALSDSPRGPYEYKGVIISNGDLHIDSYKPAEKCAYYCANNHGSIEKIGDDWFIFYHRHTNGTNYSRQGCFEKLSVDENGIITQAQMSSCGGIKPLAAKGTYPTYIACNLYLQQDDLTYIPWAGWLGDKYPIITQDGKDGDIAPAYITNMLDGATAGFKYFDCRGVKQIEIVTMGYGTGNMQIRLEPDGPVVGEVKLRADNIWCPYTVDVNIEDGIHDLYITYSGEGWSSIREFTWICDGE